jgi:hypothetical protein
MRMTDAEVKRVVAAARMSEAEKDALLRRALSGEPEARFAVFWLARRTKSCESTGPTPMPLWPDQRGGRS